MKITISSFVYHFHKTSFLLAVCFIITGTACSVLAEKIVVAAPQTSNKQLSEAIKDLRSHLHKMTDRTVILNDGDRPSVILELLSDDQVVNTPLEGRSREAFHLHGKADGPMRIRARSQHALSDGIYDYLRELGVHWLLPGENWTVIPTRSNITLKIDSVREPKIRTRRFFVNGAFGGYLAVDQTRSVRSAWLNWQRRLKFGGPNRFSGHAGEAFNKRHRKVLEANPNMRAEVDGKRKPWAPGTKPCYANPELIRLYVTDRLEEMQNLIDRDPDAPQAFSVSVDPADGAGHCECADCRAIGSVSDRVFSLANHVGRAMAKRFPDRYASLYAYHAHAAVPSIDLEPNLYVMLIPYSFQRTGLTAEQFIEQWAQKVDHLAIYDYWSNTDWSYDQPTTSLFNRAEPRVAHWKRNGVQHVMIESTGSAGAVGPVLWVASRMMWGDDRPAHAILSEFCDLAFGDAAPPMLRMLTRWHELYLLNGHELGLCYKDLAEADALTSDPMVRSRIDDFKRYVHYLRLWHEYLNFIGRSPERLEKAYEIMRYTWRIYDSKMVHTYRLNHLLAVTMERPSNKQIVKDWPWHDREAAIWKKIKPYSSTELESLMKNGRVKYRPAKFDRREFSRNYVPVMSDSDRLFSARNKPEWVRTPLTHGRQEFVVVVPDDESKFVLKYIGRDGGEDYVGTQVLLYDDQGKSINRQVIPSDGKEQRVIVRVPSSGRYQLAIHAHVYYTLEFPRTLPISQTTLVNYSSTSPPIYFYVPRGQRYIALHERSFVEPLILDPNGQSVPLDGQRGFIRIKVPKGMDGQIWAIRNLNSPYPMRMINLPHLLAFTPEGVLAPAEVLDQIQ